MRSASARPRPRGWRRFTFSVAAIVVGLSPFVVLEAVLSAFNVGDPAGYEDPFVGFNRLQPLFEWDEEEGNFRTAHSRELTFGVQRFAATKSDDTFRVFCLGGSTVRGRPYDVDTAFARWLEIELNGCRGTPKAEVINCGGVSYASYRLMPIVEEALEHDADLVVVATGHNEFLEDRTYRDLKSRSPARQWLEGHAYSLRSITLARRLLRGDEAANGTEVDGEVDGKTILPDEVDAILDQESGYASYHRDDAWRKDVVAHYEQTLRAMVAACRAAGVPILFVELGENLRDCPPFKSEHPADFSFEDDLAFNVAFDAAEKAELRDLDEALEQYRKAESLDSDYALLAYHIARVLDRQGKSTEAAAYYLKAKDLDVCPLRMLEATHASLARVAAETGTPLVEARRRLEDLSPDRIPGYDWYLDHVHPTIGGHQQIAQAISATIVEQGWLGDDCRWNTADRRVAYREHLDELGLAYLANGYRRVGWLENWARRQRLYGETLPVDAGGFLRLGHRHLDFADSEAAWQSYRDCLALDPAMARPLLDHALALFEQGRTEAAIEIVERWTEETGTSEVTPGLAMAELALALDEGRPGSAADVYTRHRDAFEALDDTAKAWLDAMPDAVERAEGLPPTLGE